MDDYDEVSGLPMDKQYLESALPFFLSKSIEQMEKAWKKHENGESSDWDCDFCELQSNINVAEVEQLITTEQAWYLRKKYLKIERKCEL